MFELALYDQLKSTAAPTSHLKVLGSAHGKYEKSMVLVIVPLVSLMKNQVSNLASLGIAAS